MSGRQFLRVSLPSDGPVAVFIVPDVVGRDATRYQAVLAIVPNPFPSIE